MNLNSDNFQELFFCIIGLGFAVFGLIMLARMLALRFFGIKTTGEIISAEKDEKGQYTHKVRYTVDGREIISRDTAGYSQAITKGTEKNIICPKNNPEKFRFADEARSNTIIYAVCVLMGMLVALRFFAAL